MAGGSRAPSGSRPRGRQLGYATALALACCLLAVTVWASRSEPVSRTLPIVQSHGLDVDQAACLDFGMVVARSDAVDLTLALGRFQGLDPAARPRRSARFRATTRKPIGT
jgi:hypothetical protein